MPKNTYRNNGSQIRKGKGPVQTSAHRLPNATEGQLDLAKLLQESSVDETNQAKLLQVQECTECSLEEAARALTSAGYDVQLAIINLLDQKVEEDSWMETTGKKSKFRRQIEQKAKAAAVDAAKSDAGTCNAEEFVETPSSSKPANVPIEKFENDPSVDPLSDVQSELRVSAEEPRKKSGSDQWDEEYEEWKGEAIEIVNSTSDFPTNIHEDSELLKLVTTEPEESPEDSVVEEPEDEETASLEEPVPEEYTIPVEGTPTTATPKDEEPAQSIKSNMFAKFARSAIPPNSHIPNAPVFFAPGAKTSSVSEAASLLCETTQTLSAIPIQPESQKLPLAPTRVQPPCSSNEPLKSEQLPERKNPRVKNRFTDPAERIKSPNQVSFQPMVNPLMSQTNKLHTDIQPTQVYQSALQNSAALPEAYVKIQEHEVVAQSRPQPPPVNSFENPNAYNYHLLNEISQNIKQANVDSRVNKTDAFTQSLSANQPQESTPYHAMQPPQQNLPKPTTASQLPKSAMPPTTNPQQQPELPITTQPQMHTALHPAIPQLLSQFHAGFPMFNLHGGSGGHTTPMFDMDQFTALQQQQRMLFELQQQSHQQQQQQQQSQVQPPPAMPQSQQVPQTIATETSLPSTCGADVLSAKSGMPMHHMTTANVGPGFAFLPYPGMVFMNGYPNAFMNQQQASQASGSQSQSSGHGGSPMSQHQTNQQQPPPPPSQYPKPMNAPSTYSGYQGLRQSNYEEMGDLFYSNLTKQVGYKHNNAGNSGPQGIYVASQQHQQQAVKAGNGPDMSALGGKMQPPNSAQQVPQQQQSAAVAPNVQPQQQMPPQTLYQQAPSPYHQQYMAMAAAAAAAQHVPNQHTLAGMTGGPGMVPMHARPQH